MSPTLPLRSEDPEHLGGYDLLGRLGEGGMGTVYLGRDGCGRRVAVKVLRADLAADRDFVERFRREADAARRVAPFCTAQVLEVRLAGERPLLVIEYVDGPTLQSRVAERGSLAPSSLVAVAVGVVAALTAIHRAGLVHRDLKPDNILLSPEGPRVIDFGIARDRVVGSTLTQAGVPLGTPPFMAPEQFTQDGPVSAAADVFAWGGIVTFAATGRPPFGDGPVGRVAYRVVHESPDLDGLGGPLRELVVAAMAKDPSARPAAQELLWHLLDGRTGAVAAAAAVVALPATVPATTQVLQPDLAAGPPRGETV